MSHTAIIIIRGLHLECFDVNPLLEMIEDFHLKFVLIQDDMFELN